MRAISEPNDDRISAGQALTPEEYEHRADMHRDASADKGVIAPCVAQLAGDSVPEQERISIYMVCANHDVVDLSRSSRTRIVLNSGPVIIRRSVSLDAYQVQISDPDLRDREMWNRGVGTEIILGRAEFANALRSPGFSHVWMTDRGMITRSERARDNGPYVLKRRSILDEAALCLQEVTNPINHMRWAIVDFVDSALQTDDQDALDLLDWLTVAFCSLPRSYRQALGATLTLSHWRKALNPDENVLGFLAKVAAIHYRKYYYSFGDGDNAAIEPEGPETVALDSDIPDTRSWPSIRTQDVLRDRDRALDRVGADSELRRIVDRAWSGASWATILRQEGISTDSDHARQLMTRKFASQIRVLQRILRYYYRPRRKTLEERLSATRLTQYDG